MDALNQEKRITAVVFKIALAVLTLTIIFSGSYFLFKDELDFPWWEVIFTIVCILAFRPIGCWVLKDVSGKELVSVPIEKISFVFKGILTLTLVWFLMGICANSASTSVLIPEVVAAILSLGGAFLLWKKEMMNELKILSGGEVQINTVNPGVLLFPFKSATPNKFLSILSLSADVFIKAIFILTLLVLTFMIGICIGFWGGAIPPMPISMFFGGLFFATAAFFPLSFIPLIFSKKLSYIPLITALLMVFSISLLMITAGLRI